MRNELAQIIERLQVAGYDVEAVTDAVLASPVIAALRAEAWDIGFIEGRTYERSTNINYRRRGGSTAANNRRKRT